MRKEKSTEEVLQVLIDNTEKNIQILLSLKDEELKEYEASLRQAKDFAYENDNFKLYKVVEEKLWQISQAKQRKYSLSDDASNWIHW